MCLEFIYKHYSANLRFKKSSLSHNLQDQVQNRQGQGLDPQGQGLNPQGQGLDPQGQRPQNLVLRSRTTSLCLY